MTLGIFSECCALERFKNVTSYFADKLFARGIKHRLVFVFNILVFLKLNVSTLLLLYLT